MLVNSSWLVICLHFHQSDISVHFLIDSVFKVAENAKCDAAPSGHMCTTQAYTNVAIWMFPGYVRRCAAEV